jgi:hypothetical protein
MVSHRRRVGPPSIAPKCTVQCGAWRHPRAVAAAGRQWAVRGSSESILNKLQYSGTGNQGHFWPWQESCLPAVRCACAVVCHSCCSGQLCCLLVGCTSVQASIYCTALGGAPVGQQERNQGSSLLPSEWRRNARGDGSGGGTMEERESLY